jgi:hypothetical protein
MSAFRTWWAEGRPLVSRWTHSKDGMELTWVAHVADAYHRYTRWVRWSWWSYVLGPRQTPKGWGRPSLAATAWCRATGHRGQIYWNPGGLEPDNRCKGCMEEIA